METVTLTGLPSPRTSPPILKCSVWVDELGGGGGGGWPGVDGGGSSREISDISTKSKSNISLATLGGRTTAGPLWSRFGGGCNLVAPEAEPAEDDAGMRPPDKSPHRGGDGGRYQGQNAGTDGSLARRRKSGKGCGERNACTGYRQTR